jgi:hypothetical protein
VDTSFWQNVCLQPVSPVMRKPQFDELCGHNKLLFLVYCMLKGCCKQGNKLAGSIKFGEFIWHGVSWQIGIYCREAETWDFWSFYRCVESITQDLILQPETLRPNNCLPLWPTKSLNFVYVLSSSAPPAVHLIIVWQQMLNDQLTYWCVVDVTAMRSEFSATNCGNSKIICIQLTR